MEQNIFDSEISDALPGDHVWASEPSRETYQSLIEGETVASQLVGAAATWTLTITSYSQLFMQCSVQRLPR